MDRKWIDESLIAFEKKYDWVVKKNHGRICYTTDESGNFDELMEKTGYFYSLYTVSQ